jgi:hypothetical protein
MEGDVPERKRLEIFTLAVSSLSPVSTHSIGLDPEAKGAASEDAARNEVSQKAVRNDCGDRRGILVVDGLPLFEVLGLAANNGRMRTRTVGFK